MATMAKALGCRGVLCDGPARDFDEIREIGDFQLLCTGASPGLGGLGGLGSLGGGRF